MTHLDDHFEGEHSGEDVIKITQDLGGKKKNAWCESKTFSCRCVSQTHAVSQTKRLQFDKSLERIYLERLQHNQRLSACNLGRCEYTTCNPVCQTLTAEPCCIRVGYYEWFFFLFKSNAGVLMCAETLNRQTDSNFYFWNPWFIWPFIFSICCFCP